MRKLNWPAVLVWFIILAMACLVGAGLICLIGG